MGTFSHLWKKAAFSTEIGKSGAAIPLEPALMSRWGPLQPCELRKERDRACG